MSVPATVIYVLMHVGCLGVLWTGVTLEALAILLGAFLLRAFGVSVVYHRYFAHRSFRTSRAMQFLLGIYGALTVMGGILWWAQTHRFHHRNADTPEDIHSPRYNGFFYSHCGWFLTHANRSVDLSQIPDLARFPELVWLESSDVVFKLAYIACCYAWFGLVGTVWGFFVPTVIVLHMVHWIQSVSHSVGGYRRYPIRDNSRNHWLFGVLSLGEGFHHNHHCFPGSARIGLRWWELDLGYWMLVVASKSGLVWDLREPSEGPRAGALVDRHVESVRSDLRVLADRLDGTMIAFAAEARQEHSARLAIDATRKSIALRVEAHDASARDLLVRGGFALQSGIEELQETVRQDVRVILSAMGTRLCDMLIEQVAMAFESSKHRRPHTVGAAPESIAELIGQAD